MGRAWARVLAAVVLLVVLSGAAHADTLIVAGKKVASPVSFVTTSDEVYAPLLTALTPLKASFLAGPDVITITTAAGRQLMLSRARPEATLDGEMHSLPSPPKMRGGTVLLPAKAVGALLGCVVRWDEATRSLSPPPRAPHLQGRNHA